jgi:hypothetical protein
MSTLSWGWHAPAHSNKAVRWILAALRGIRLALDQRNEAMLCLSTVHIEPPVFDTHLSFESPYRGFSFYPNQYGGFLMVPSRSKLEDSALHDLPPCLEAVIHYAATRGYQWIKLDPAGHVVAELAQFHWETP